MEAAYPSRMVALLGGIARLGRTGRLLLDAGRGPHGGALTFSTGVLAAWVRPGGPGADGAAAPTDAAGLRQEIASASRVAGRKGGIPGFESLDKAQPPLAGAPTAADLAIDFGRQIEDVAWLMEQLRSSLTTKVGQPASPPLARPHVSLGPAEGFLLSRADGTLTLQQILDSAPVGETEVLRAVYALRAVGMLSTANATVEPGPPGAGKARLSDLERFLNKTSAAGTRFTTEEQTERDELIARCRAIAELDHFALLGVDRTAGESAVRQAYYRLARRHHPDRLIKPHLEDIHRDLEMMFAAITDAYNTLSHPLLRAEYDRELSDRTMGRRKPDAQDKQAAAREAYLRGRKEADAGHLFEALRFFELSVQNDPTKADYFHHLGVCQGQNPRWRKKAEENLLAAIKLNPGSVRSYLELARVYQKGGLGRRAIEMYQQVLQWEPANEEALSALGRGKDATGPGLLGGLFKKD